ncbi:MAG: hypothetical protein JNJ43_15255 [Anaerolineales bacterium]|nr:hypothetical protein [Anaerolineales bacterium]
MIKKVLGIHYKSFLFFFVLGASITFALGRYLQFHSTGNDFWNILYYGRNMTLSQPESWYNGFYPFGYAFLIGQMPFTYILPIAYIINSLLAGLFTASVSTFLVYTQNIFAVLIATFGSIAAPFVFQSIHTIGPDIGAAAFVAFAVFLLWKNYFERQNDFTNLNSILIGISLGLGFLTRTHVIISAVAIFFSYFLLIGIRPFRSRILMAGVFLLFVWLQVIVNLASGHGAFETAQAFNMYKFLYGFNSTYPPAPAEIAQFSLFDEITRNPRWFFQAYLIPFQFLISYAFMPVICFVLSPKGKFSKYALFSFLYIILYSIPIAVGDSARAPLMIMNAYITCMAFILATINAQAERYIPKIKWTGLAVGILFIVLSFNTYKNWLFYDAEFIRANASERKNLSVIEATLLTNGMKSPTEIFADRYDFYTPNTMPYRSRQLGNWNMDWVWGYKEEYPPLPNDSIESFLIACKEQGIRYLVLSQNSYHRGEIFSLIYNEEINLEFIGLRFIGQRGNMRIYEVK